MAELDTNTNFGIEETMSRDTAGTGDQNLLDNLFSSESSTADPNDVSSIDDDDDNNNDNNSVGSSKKGPDGKANVTSLAGKDDDIPESTANDPDALTNFLLGGDDDDNDDNDNDVEEEDEEEIDTTTETTTANLDNDDDENEPEGSISFSNLANELADLGVFSRGEGEEESISIETPEDFLERFKAEKELAANNMVSEFIGRFGEEHQEAFKAIYVNGANPREYFAQAAKIEDFTNLDLTKEANQESVVRQSLQDQGFDQEDIDAEIDKLKNYGDLEDVSKRHHKVLVKKEKQTLKQKEAQAAQDLQLKQAQKDEYTQNVRSVLQEKIKAKDFDGIPVNVNTANELQDFLLVDKWKTVSGETLTDFDKTILDLKKPENHATKVKVGLLLKLLEKDPTLSTIQKRGVSKKSSQLFKDVARQKTSAQRAAGNKKQPAKSWWQN